MKKFRLVQEYPNCFMQKGDVITFKENSKWCVEHGIELDLETVESNLYKFFAPINTEEYLSEYNSPQNIGSVHWFNTIGGQALRCAEFIAEKPEHEYTQQYAKWIYNVLQDFFKARKDGLINLKG